MKNDSYISTIKAQADQGPRSDDHSCLARNFNIHKKKNILSSPVTTVNILSKERLTIIIRFEITSISLKLVRFRIQINPFLINELVF